MNLLSPEEKTAAMQLFELKHLIRNKVDECLKCAETTQHPTTARWYRYFAHELDQLLAELRRKNLQYKEVK